jgi:hypothetical protein
VQKPINHAGLSSDPEDARLAARIFARAII